MKVKVLIPFNDKHTGKKHKNGDIFDVSASRFNEILARGKFVQLVEESAATVEKNEKKENK